jgi:hypothetical protein
MLVTAQQTLQNAGCTDEVRLLYIASTYLALGEIFCIDRKLYLVVREVIAAGCI